MKSLGYFGDPQGPRGKSYCDLRTLLGNGVLPIRVKTGIAQCSPWGYLKNKHNVWGIRGQIFFVSGLVFLSLDIPNIGLVMVGFCKNPVRVILINANNRRVPGVKNDFLYVKIKMSLGFRRQEDFV